jgi:signal peptidase II
VHPLQGARGEGGAPLSDVALVPRPRFGPTFWVVWPLALLVFALDRWTKAWAVHALAPVGSRPLFDDWFRLTYVRNSGVAFGLGAGRGLPFAAITLVALGLVVALALSPKSRTWPRSIALGLIVGGAAGNLLDRMRWGSVIDFLDFGVRDNWFPVFNAADSCITIGVILFALTLLGERDTTHDRHAHAPDRGDGERGAA